MTGHRVDVKREGHGFAVTIDGDSPRLCAEIGDVVAMVGRMMPGPARMQSMQPGKVPANGDGAADVDPQGEAAGSTPDAAVS